MVEENWTCVSSGVAVIGVVTPSITGSFSLGNFEFKFCFEFDWMSNIKGNITLYWSVTISTIMDDFWLKKMRNLLILSKEVSCLANALFILLWRTAKCGGHRLLHI